MVFKRGVFRFCLLMLTQYALSNGEPREEKRLLTGNENDMEAQLHQMDLTIQNLKSTMNGYENFVNQMHTNMQQMESSILLLNHEILEKDNQIKNLTKVLSSVQFRVEQMVGCQTGSFGHHSFTPISLKTFDITFKQPFPMVPKLTWGFRTLDFASDTNDRITADIVTLTRSGFSMNLYAWADTKAYNIEVQWMSCP